MQARETDRPEGDAATLGARVKTGVLWRSGSQIGGQLIAWSATLLVIRLLSPGDYGLVAMTGAVLAFLDLFKGWGFASALVRHERTDSFRIGQAFGLLILTNAALAAIQLALAPLAADYFRQPMVADLLRVQALFYLANPFTALGHALLARRLEFKRQSRIDLVAAALSAATALGCALAGLGVWTLVVAPGVLWYSRAAGYVVATRMWEIRPRFRFAGAGELVSYGSAMMLVQLCWFAQSQMDVFIGGRVLDPHRLGLYTTALFVTQILAAKFIPPLNEVAFAAYARMQDRPDAIASAFLKTVRLISLVAMPFYFGLAVTAEPLVATVLGWRWVEAAPLAPILAMAMSFMTLQILFGPATNAIGRPGLQLRVGALGASIMTAAFFIGINWGATGLAWAWLGGMASLLVATVLMSLPAIGARKRDFLGAAAPGVVAAAAMALLVAGFDRLLPPLGEAARLGLLASFGAAAYAGLLLLFARKTVDEMIALVRPARPSAI
ncbi:lipopolysaccharide biosynthesis protein [Sphingosinicella sp.]|uniref:lipopolysaccharide biosynthesis protein n=1 Tax=Sphingosinicella sp. TaxID=1917971 RepID=UPI004037D5AC